MAGSGAPYPHPNPVPGSNAIGTFVIGVSPIGDIPPFDVWATMLSQYANSPILTSFCTNFALYVDQTKNLSDFYDNIWNIDTAIGYGLDVLGRIIGVSRILRIPTPSDYFGFEEATDGNPFGQAPFYAGEPLTENFALSDDAFRLLLFAKAFANICDGSIPSINQLLLSLFPGEGNCYVTDGLDMSMTYTFKFILTPLQLSIIEFSGVMPKSTGVSLTIVESIG